MKKTPKALRLHIGVFGRTNVGKSSFLNMMLGQDAAITSSVAGTTTDVVEKTMELLPVGPVVFLDTAGMDDISELAGERLKKTEKIFTRADIVCLIVEPEKWTDFEEKILERSTEHNIPVIAVINKIDLGLPGKDFVDKVKSRTDGCIQVSSVRVQERDDYINAAKERIMQLCPDDFLTPPPLISDLVFSGESVILIVPIDLQAPKGRIILPQVQTIRDALDSDAISIVVKEREYAHALSLLRERPALAVCDSQVVLKMVADTPPDVKCTTFSILFSRYKGDLVENVKGACAIDKLKSGDKVLIAESCSHHPIEDDIGRVKIPRWMKQYTGKDIKFDFCAGKDYPDDLSGYALVVQCGGCMTNRKEIMFRINSAKKRKTPITNYGVCISFLQGVLKRVLSPFPAAMDAYEKDKEKYKS